MSFRQLIVFRSSGNSVTKREIRQSTKLAYIDLLYKCKLIHTMCIPFSLRHFPFYIYVFVFLYVTIVNKSDYDFHDGNQKAYCASRTEMIFFVRLTTVLRSKG